MINEVIRQADGIFEDNSWISHYGGLVVPVTLDSLDTDESISQQTFPYSCDLVSSNCDQDRKFLVPGEDKSAVAYWETISDQNRVEESIFAPPGVLGHYQQNVRFVLWYNSRSLGYDSVYKSRLAMINSISKAFSTFKAQSNGVGINRIDFQQTAVSQPQDESVFSKYTYFPEYQELFKKPYDWIAFDFQASWFVSEKCVDEFSIKSAINC